MQSASTTRYAVPTGEGLTPSAYNDEVNTEEENVLLPCVHDVINMCSIMIKTKIYWKDSVICIVVMHYASVGRYRLRMNRYHHVEQ